MSNENNGRKAAETFRSQHALGIEPITNMARMIEQKLGIGVAYVETSESSPGHGMTMSLGKRFLVAVGCTDHPMRLRSTLAHELGHLQLGSVDRSLNHSKWDKRTPEEIQADSFARHLLMPLAAVEAVKTVRQEAKPPVALLSNLVQKYKASPEIVAIQLREAEVINRDTYEEWKTFSTGQLASQFGWHTEYVALATESKMPRAPQELLARAIEGYRWGLVTPAVLARLTGQRNPGSVAAQLKEDGVVPTVTETVATERPAIAGTPLTAEELANLKGKLN